MKDGAIEPGLSSSFGVDVDGIVVTGKTIPTDSRAPFELHDGLSAWLATHVTRKRTRHVSQGSLAG